MSGVSAAGNVALPAVLAGLEPSDLSLIKPPTAGLFGVISWCRRFHSVTEGDRFPSHRTTQVSSSVSCPYLNPQPCLPALCRGSVSVHTAVSGLGLQESSLKIDTKLTMFFPVRTHLGSGDLYEPTEKNVFSTKQNHWQASCKSIIYSQ